jgi:hypothetical protein
VNWQKVGRISPTLTKIHYKEGNTMRINKSDVPVKISIPGATARQEFNFGDASGYGNMAGEYFSLNAGVDFAPLLKGLENDLCQSPHWGYLIEGEIVVNYADGSEETVTGGDLFFWPPGHTIRITADAEVILFSPQQEHCAVVDHVKTQLGV